MSSRLALALAFSMLAVALPIWGFFVEPSLLLDADYVIGPPGWPDGCDGLRIAVLSDLHVGSPFNGRDKLNDVIALTRRADPDLILLAGD